MIPSTLPQCLGWPDREPGFVPRVHWVEGPRGLPAWALSELCPHLARGASVYWIDAGNRFDAHGLAKTALSQGHDPALVLGRVLLARPFNAYQMVTLLSQKREEIPVVLSDPWHLFFDEEFPLAEARRAARLFQESLRRVSVPLVCLLPQRACPRDRAGLAAALHRDLLRHPGGTLSAGRG